MKEKYQGKKCACKESGREVANSVCNKNSGELGSVYVRNVAKKYAKEYARKVASNQASV